MQRKIIEQEITELQDIIKEQSEILFSHPDIIPRIELDIVLENMRKLYTLFHELNLTEKAASIRNSRLPDPETMDKITRKRQELHQRGKQETEGPEANDQETEAAGPVFNIDTSIEKEPLRQDEFLPPKSAPKDRAVPDDEPQPAEEEEKNDKNPDLFSSGSKTLADNLKFGDNSVYDKLGKEAKKDILADKLKQNKIGDLRAAIGIHEKFLLVNELFGGSMHEYDEAINALNQFEGFGEASVFLSHLKEKYKMDEGSDSYKTLLLSVNKRYL